MVLSLLAAVSLLIAVPLRTQAQATGAFGGAHTPSAAYTAIFTARINAFNNMLVEDQTSSTSFPFDVLRLTGSAYANTQVTRLSITSLNGGGISDNGSLTYCYFDSGQVRINTRIPNTANPPGYTPTYNIMTNGAAGSICTVGGDGTVYLTVGDGTLATVVFGSTFTVTPVTGTPAGLTGVAMGYNGQLLLSATGGTYVGTITSGAWSGSLVTTRKFYKSAAYQDSTGKIYLEDASTQAGYQYTLSAGSYTEASWTKPFGVTANSYSSNSSGTLMVAAATQIMLQFPSSLTFPPTATGTADPVEELVFKFATGGTLSSTNVSSPGGAADFTDAGTGTCTTNGTAHTYAAGDLCTMDVTFNPTRGGTRTGSITFKDAANAVMATASLTGTGIGPTVDHLAFTAVPTTSSMGTSFSVTAKAYSDAAGTTVATFVNGTGATVTSSDSAATLPTGATFTSGVATFNVTLNTIGSKTITVGDAAGTATVTSRSIAVGAAVNHFAITGAPSASTAGTSFNVTVTAYSDSGTTVATNYTGPVAFTSSDGSAAFPTTLTMTNGVGTFAITLKTAGPQTITVADASGPPSASSGSVLVSAAGAASIAATGSTTIGTSPGAAFGPTALQVQVLDAFSNSVSGATVTYTVPSSGASATLSASTCTTNSSGFCSVTATANSQAGSYTIAARTPGAAAGVNFTATNTIVTAGTAGYNFGSVNLGASASVSIVFNFTASTAVSTVNIVTQGATGKDFLAQSPDTSTTLCTATTYTNGQSCTVDVTFSPLALGRRLGAIVLRNASGQILSTEYITGSGTGAQLGSPAPSVSTFAGQGTFSTTSPVGLSGTAAGFIQPTQLAFDGDGNLYMSDQLAESIYKITPRGLVSSVIGQFRTSCGTTYDCGYPRSNSTKLAASSNIFIPQALMVDGAGQLWFTDNSVGGIATVDLATGYVTAQVPGSATIVGAPANSGNIHSLGAASLGFAFALANDGLGNVYVGSYYDGSLTTSYGQILKLDAAGNVSLYAGSTTPYGSSSAPADGDSAATASITAAVGMGFDSAGNLYYLDQGRYIVYKIDTNGKVHPFAGSGSVASDNTASLPYWLSGTASTTPNTAVNLANKSGFLTVDPSGNVYLPSMPSSYTNPNASSRVFVFTPSGYAYVLAGTGTIADVDGPASTSQVSYPTSVALNGTGDVFISETYGRVPNSSPAQYVGASVRKWSVPFGATSFSFATTNTGQKSSDSPKSVSLMNLGNAALALSTPATGKNPSISTSFQVDSASTCPQPSATPSGTLAVGASCGYAINFIPTTGGSISGSLILSGNLIPPTISLSGTGVQVLDHLTLTSVPSTTTAGTSFNVTLTAYADSGTTVATNYTGPVTISSTDTSAVFTSSFTLTNGTGSFAITLNNAGVQTITVADQSGSPTTTSSNITVNAAAASTIAASSGSGQSAGIGTAFTSPLKVQVLDRYSNPVGGVLVNLTVPSSGASATLSATSCTTSTTAPIGYCSVTATANATVSSTSYNVSAAVAGVSTPATFALTNTKRSTSLTLTPSSTSLSYGQSVTLSAVITPATVGGVAPTGTVTFYDGTTTVLTSTATVTNGVATYTAVAPSTGSHTYDATYNGDSNFSASAQTPATASVSVSVSKSKVVVTVPATQTFAAGTASSITITVAGPYAGTGVALPSGYEVCKLIGPGDSALVVTEMPNLTNGSVTVPIPNTLVSGTYHFNFFFGGDTNYTVDNSFNGQYFFQVGQVAPTIAFTAPSSSITYGTPLGIAATATYNSTTVPGTITYTATPAGGSATPVTSATVLTAGAYTLTANFTPTDTTTYSTASATMSLNVAQFTPVITWTNPADIAYSTALGATQLNATVTGVGGASLTTAGTLTYLPPAGTTLNAGTAQPLKVTFTPADTTNYANATKTVALSVTQAAQSITFTPPASPLTYGVSPITLSATSTSSLGVAFSVLSGPGSITGNTLTVNGAGTIVVAANQPGNTNYSAATQVTQSITVNQAPQVITFTPPASPVTYGVSPITLSATSTSSLGVTFSVLSGPGTLTGNTLAVNGAGTIVIAANQSGNANYTAATQVTQSITVNQTTQTITFTPLSSPVTYGISPIALSATSSSSLAVTFSVLSGRATVSGSTLTITGAGTVVVAADQSGNANYNAATQVTRTLVVSQATPTLTWSTPTAIAFGTPLGAAQLNASATGIASATLPGTFTYSSPLGTLLAAGANQTLTVTFIPTDTSNYTSATATTTITVNRTAPNLVWTPSSNLVYGQPLSAQQLNASVTGVSGALPGNFVYNPPLGTVLSPGTGQTLGVQFTPTDSANYSTINGTATIAVSKATSTLTAPSTQPVFVIFNQTGSIPVSIAGQFSTQASVSLRPQFAVSTTVAPPSGSISYAILNASNTSVASGSLPISSGAVSIPVASTLAPGLYTVSTTYAGDTNYLPAPPVTISLQVGQIQPIATITAPGSALTYGAPLGIAASASYNGTSVAGIFTYTAGTASVTPATVLPAGNYTLTASFTPTDTLTYKTAVTTSSLTVNKATPTVSLAPVSPILVQNALTFTATVSSAAGTPNGTVSFYDGASSTALGSTPLSNGVATFTTSSLAVGSHTITALYSGDTNFISLTSPAITAQINDFNLTISATSNGTTTQTILPGGTATYAFTIAPTGATTFPSAVNLTVSGLPTGATYTITPSTLAAGSGSTNVTLTVTVPKQTALLHHSGQLAPIALALLLLPLSGRMRRSAARLGRITSMLLLILAGAGALATLTGCGSQTGFFAQAQQSYNVTITGTSGALVHSTTVTLTVQ